MQNFAAVRRQCYIHSPKVPRGDRATWGETSEVWGSPPEAPPEAEAFS